MKQNSTHSKSILLVFALLLGGSYVMTLAAGEKAPKADKQTAPSTNGDFIRGAELWADNCARCHNMRDPKDLNDREWKVVTSHMRIRAGLTGKDTRDILEFLQRSN